MPNEDQGYVMAQLVMPDAASLERTSETSARMRQNLCKESGAVDNRTVINGYSLIDGQYKSNVATFFVTFKDFKERYSFQRARRQGKRRRRTSAIAPRRARSKRGMFIPIAPPAIPGIGTTGGFEFWIQDKGAGDPEICMS